MFRNQLEGRQRVRTETQFAEFCNCASPESAVENSGKFPPPLRQLKDRGVKIRGLGVWCQGPGYDLFVLQALFRKGDENKIYSRIEAFRSRAEDLDDRFSGRDKEWIAEKVTEWNNREEFIVHTREGLEY